MAVKKFKPTSPGRRQYLSIVMLSVYSKVIMIQTNGLKKK